MPENFGVPVPIVSPGEALGRALGGGGGAVGGAAGGGGGGGGAITTGMDIAAVGALAAEMNRAAQEIRQVAQTVNSKMQSTPWAGPDRTRFESEWTGQRMPQLNQIALSLEEAAQVANTQAQQQSQASNA